MGTLERWVDTFKDPQTEDAPIRYYCSHCDEPIRAGEEAYLIPDGAVYCETCVANAHTIID